MKKDEVLSRLEKGEVLQNILPFRSGQGGEIVKEAGRFSPGTEIIYVPDLILYDISIDAPIFDKEERDQVIANCYTGDDFLSICAGDSTLASRLFDWCDWQSPESALPEVIAAYSGDGDAAFYG